MSTPRGDTGVWSINCKLSLLSEREVLSVKSLLTGVSLITHTNIVSVSVSYWEDWTTFWPTFSSQRILVVVVVLEWNELHFLSDGVVWPMLPNHSNHPPSVFARKPIFFLSSFRSLAGRDGRANFLIFINASLREKLEHKKSSGIDKLLRSNPPSLFRAESFSFFRVPIPISGEMLIFGWFFCDPLLWG